jgi:hypothetical protein
LIFQIEHDSFPLFDGNLNLILALTPFFLTRLRQLASFLYAGNMAFFFIIPISITLRADVKMAP